MPAAATVYAPNTTPGDARLADLGVPATILQEALVEGAMARDRCTPNHPPTFPGLLAWGETVRALRDRLAPSGWRRNDAGGLSTVVDAGGLVAIAVATGDEATGDAAFPPSTKYTKGPSTQLMIEGNQGVLEFMREERTGDGPRRVTWLLLFRRIENEIRAELSLPVAIGVDGRVDAWQERIILSPIRLDGVNVPDVDPEPTAEIVVEVNRIGRTTSGV